MRRSSRVILLLGAFLAIGAFLLILLFGGGGPGPGATPTPGTVQVVVAAVDIPLGTTITSSMIRTRAVPVTQAGSAFTTPEQVVGKVTRQGVVAGEPITETTFTGTAAVTVNIPAELNAGERAIAIEVDQVSGVGTLIQPGDRVDAVVTLSAADIPITFSLPEGVEVCPEGQVFCDVGATFNATSVKVVVQNVRVVATLLPPAAQGTPAPEEPALTGRAEIVIVAVNAQQAEVLRFGQSLTTPRPITLLLRSTKDDPAATPDVTTGIILKTMIEVYGVLPPDIILVPLPTPLP